MQLISRLRKLSKHELTKDASWLLLGSEFNFFIQVAFFIVLARILGVREYGIFAGAYALVNTVTPYSPLGSGLLFMRYVSEDSETAPIYWGNALLTLFGTTTIISILFVLVGPSITKVHDRALILWLVLGNCLFRQLTQVSTRIFQTFRQMRLAAMMTVVTNLARLASAAVMWVVLRHATALQWAFAIMIASGVTAIFAFWQVRKFIPGLAFKPRLLVTQFWEGISFSFSSSTQAVYNDFDKTLLSRNGLNYQNGFYTLAYRVIDFAATPITSIDMATLPRYFQLKLKGLRAVLRLGFKSIRMGALLSVGLGIAVWVVAPVVPYLAGHDYAGAITALHWLCVIPLCRSVHMISGSVLTATGRQHIRLALQVTIALFNLGANLYLIPRVGWIAAAWVSVASDGLLAALSCGLLLWLWFNLPAVREQPTLAA